MNTRFLNYSILQAMLRIEIVNFNDYNNNFIRMLSVIVYT